MIYNYVSNARFFLLHPEKEEIEEDRKPVSRAPWLSKPETTMEEASSFRSVVILYC
jgi:hypothetical protein